MSFHPNQIIKEHVKAAVAKIKDEKPELRPSTRWLVKIGEETYPPKEVMRYARQQFDGSDWWRYGGGPPTNKYLERMGFEIIDMDNGKNPYLELIRKYKIYLDCNGLDDEVYKWQLVEEHKGRPDITKEDLGQEIKNLKSANLIYGNAITAMRHLAEKRSEDFRESLEELFDEAEPLISRLKNFEDNSLKLFNSIFPEENLNHSQDERTISLLLTYKYPDKYTFFKNSYYKKLCKILNLKPKSKGEKYNHYLDLIQEFVKDYINKDEELISKVKELLPDDAFKDGQHLLLAQDILYNVLDKKEVMKTNYWIYSPGENAEFWDEFYQKGIMGLGWDYLGDLSNYDSKEEIIAKMQEVEETDGSKKNDATACDDFLNKMNIGDVVIVKKGRNTLIGYGEVVSNYYYDSDRNTFKNLRKVHWKKKGKWNAGHALILKTLTDITKYPSEFSQFDYYYERLLAIIDEEVVEPSKVLGLPLNCILYGPPGTGKTFKLQNEYFDNFSVKETSLSRSQYLENIISDLTWWQVLSIILLDIKKSKVNDITAHELLGIKGKLSNSKTVRPTVWGRLQAHSKLECPNVNVSERSQPAIFYKDEESYWTVDEELLEQYYPEAFTILEQVRNFKPNEDKLIRNYEFVTFHQSFSYEDFIEGIKPKLEDQENEISYEIQDGIFKKLCLKADADRDNNYAIFIDEINRGNVSAIFGELITLIEQDKRLGEENELRAKLPYSKKELGVPPNLHIFGTMNTADRSVEALDTALRRRFAFEEVMPIPELLDNIEFDKFNLSQVLKVINERIEALLDRDHTIGHSYFISIQTGDTAALKYAFENKVIPLLQEYFYHDYEKIALILGEGFVEHREAKVRFANFKKIDQPELDSSYELKTIEDIEEAILILLNKLDEEGE